MLSVNAAEELPTALAQCQLLMSQAINYSSIVSAIVESCKKLFSSPNYIGIYVKKAKFFESRLPHERRSSRVPFGEGILGNIVSHTEEPLAFSSMEIPWAMMAACASSSA